MTGRMMKRLLSRYAPPALLRLSRDVYFSLRLLPGYAYDYRRFLVFAGLNKSRPRQEERAARITLHGHQVEKGLSLAMPRPGFGMAVIPDLLRDIDGYCTCYGVIEPATAALAALDRYIAFHDRIGHPMPAVADPLKRLLERHQVTLAQLTSWQGGAMAVTRKEIASARLAGFGQFFAARHSVRQFSGGPIQDDDIQRAVATAQKTPSVCNRQSWRVHAYRDQQQIHRLLEIQGGSRGFGEQASVLLAITAELGAFLGVAERYQPWIDGGMFAMSLVLALHDLGYGTCCLNWSKEPADDRRLRSVAGIPRSEQIIMLLAVGTLPETFMVAQSPRLPVQHCLQVH